YPEGDQGDLWLLGGQSNMAGFGQLKEELEPNPRILVYANDNEWQIAKDPLCHLYFPAGNSHGVQDYTHLPVEGSGLSLFFAKHLIQATNRPIGLIGILYGTLGHDSWDPTMG